MSDLPRGAHYYSPSQTTFYAADLQAAYQQANNWPADLVAVDDQTFETYGLHPPPEGMTRGADPVTGQPVWVPLPPPPPPTLAQQAAIMLARGIQIVSTANPQLSGVYPCDQTTSNQESGLLAAISAGLQLPMGVAVRVDTSGNPHAFPQPDFLNYCQAKMFFTQQLTTVMGTNQGVLPEQPTWIP